ncbi:hypothetical protein D3261_10485 [Halococcus sp. IIIV-5B]|nr:hypothetical protein D3261_10485 [Halococcus sp. IIIV-5B]
MARDFTDDDRRSGVFDNAGNRVGTVNDVRDGNAYVDTSSSDTDSGILDSIMSALGWNDSDDTHELRNDDVDHYDDDGVHLRQL